MSVVLDMFLPTGTATLPVTSTSASVALPGGAVPSGSKRTVRLYASADCFVEFGGAAVAATAGGATTASPDGSMALAGGAVELFGPFEANTYIAAVCASGQTATLRITAGEGC